MTLFGYDLIAQSFESPLQKSSHATVSLRTHLESTAAQKTEPGWATAFFIELRNPADSTSSQLFLATANHAVEAKEGCYFRLTKRLPTGEPDRGETQTITLHDCSKGWIRDTLNDIAVLPVERLLGASGIDIRSFYVYGFSEESIPSKKEWGTFYHLSTITLIGYPRGYIDGVNYLPIFYTGHFGSVPNADFRGREWFIIDLPMNAGSSGSPVVESELLINHEPSNGNVRLLGLATSLVRKNLERRDYMIRDTSGTSLPATIRHDIGLGIAVRSYKILELKRLLFK